MELKFMLVLLLLIINSYGYLVPKYRLNRRASSPVFANTKCSLVPLCAYNGAEDISGGKESSIITTIENDMDKIVRSVAVREEDLQQQRDLEAILNERAQRFYDPRVTNTAREKCILVGVDATDHNAMKSIEHAFSIQESLSELSELVGTAGLVVCGCLIQRLPTPHVKTYIGSGKIKELAELIKKTLVKTVVIDDDLSSKQQRNLEGILANSYHLPDVKILDRSAIILEIFAQHAQSGEGQLQVELAMLEYRLTRGPAAKGTSEHDSGCGFRGPGETKLETDKRVIRDRIVLLKKELMALKLHRSQHRKHREKLNIPVVALVGYTNAGKSTLMNKLSKAGVLAENLLFATLDPTTRRIRLPKSTHNMTKLQTSNNEEKASIIPMKGTEVLLTDTVGFISKLPTHLIAAFRATLEEVQQADLLVVICDRSSPVWEKQRITVYEELQRLGCVKPVIEVWNKIDLLSLEEQLKVKNETTINNIKTAEEHIKQLFVQRKEHDDKIILDVEEVVIANELEDDNDNADDADDEGEDKDKQHKPMQPVKDKKKRKKRQMSSLLSITTVDNDEETDAEELASIDKNSTVATATAIVSNEMPFHLITASAKTGEGLEELIGCLEQTIDLTHVPLQLTFPYETNDTREEEEIQTVIAMIYDQGVVEEEEFTVTGRRIICRVPNTLLPFLPVKFILSPASTIYKTKTQTE